MKKILMLGGIGIAVIIGLVVIVGILLPNDYDIRRKIVIKTKRDVVHEYVANLDKWDSWAPWKDDDPTIVVKMGDKTTGVGANQSWDGNSGDGNLTFTKCSIEEGIAYDISFNKDQYKSVAAITYKDVEGGIEVEWAMQGKAEMPVVGGFFAKLMDGMVGPMFESGLGKLKKAVEEKE